jgi:hypothetical protein
MNVALRRPMTMPEFLEWESGQEFRYEFDGFQPVAMTGGILAHATIQRNLAVSLTGRLRGTSYNFLGSDLKIEAAKNTRTTAPRSRSSATSSNKTKSPRPSSPAPAATGSATFFSTARSSPCLKSASVFHWPNSTTASSSTNQTKPRTAGRGRRLRRPANGNRFPRAEPALGVLSQAPALPAKSGAKTHRPKLVASLASKASIVTKPPQAAGGRIANFDLPSHFDDIILGHEIPLLR